MTFEEFKNHVKDNILNYLPDEYQEARVELNETQKNNGKVLTGLSIRPENTTIAPCLYLEDFYAKMTSENQSIIMICSQIAEIYQQALEQGKDNNLQDFASAVTDYEQVKAKVLPKLINRERNTNLLATVPHMNVADDLAVIYYVPLVNNKEIGMASFTIRNDMLAAYGASVEELHEQAQKNQKDQIVFKSMIDTLCEIMIPGYNQMSETEKEEAAAEFCLAPAGDSGPAMNVISNKTTVNGAAAILDTDTLDKIEEKLGKFIIIPSSIHECILVTGAVTVSDIEQMIQEVNQTQVDPLEQLSDHAYAYDSETKELYRADREAEREQSKEDDDYTND